MIPTMYPLDTTIMANHAGRQLLADSISLLGPCTPLPALFEEVLRNGQGLTVASRRYRRVGELITEIRALPAGMTALADAITDSTAPLETRLLAATLWAHARPEDARLSLPNSMPDSGNDPNWLPIAMACLPYPDPEERYSTLLVHLLLREQGSMQGHEDLPTPLTLLSFLKGLTSGTLTYQLFSAAVLQGRVLHPGVAAHRPLCHLHRLLDYLGLSSDEHVRRMYRQLVALIWPQASPDNWPRWYWVTQPGGPDIFPDAVRSVAFGEHSIIRFHELRYARLPSKPALHTLLSGIDMSVLILLGWLRTDLRDVLRMLYPTLDAALHWMLSSNAAAAATASSRPDWWDDWVIQGLPAALLAVRWLEAAPYPPAPTANPAAWRRQWLERTLLPNYQRICANLLLAQSASGEHIDDILALAEAEHLPAVRALALLPIAGKREFTLLKHLARDGSLPVQAAANNALEGLAQRQGLPSAEELGRQHLLAAAWEQGPLAGERVRVGWQEGAYRLRLSLQAGKVQLEVIGPHGPMHIIPTALRRSEAYHTARSAQRETQAQYRLFRQHLESHLLNGTPLTLGEFRYLLTNPVFAHLAERLLWCTMEGQSILWAAPERWETLTGEMVALGDRHSSSALTITLVHPVALDSEGVLGRWQSLAADRRLIQPFKQLFREIYILDSEEGTHCERFAGRAIASQRAYALLRASGFAPGNGTARREWPHGVTAHLCWADGARGRDLFGPHRKPEVSTGDIWFTRNDAVLPLQEVDPILFSETLRTADLLTTRAAVGEAQLTSRETVALRALLLREMARSFNLTNIAVPEDGRFAVVLGARATYRVNLTTGTVMLEPEGRQILVPQHDARWRPTEEGDATSEVLAITLALAHDETIDDLTFISQL